MREAEYKVFLTNILNPVSDTTCEWLENSLLVLKRTGPKQYKIHQIGDVKKLLDKYLAMDASTELFDFSNKIVMPSFFDVHFHWVQDDVRSMPKDSLLEWLQCYTWPYEAKFKSADYAKKRATVFFEHLARVGTLGGACYSSLHGHALDIAMKEAKGSFVIGNVLMTMNSPDYLSQSKKQALELVRKFTARYSTRYALTPRFAPTTHPDVMKESVKMARKSKSFMQTHLSETPNEIEYVLSLYRDIPGFEDVSSYTEIYKRCGFLGPKCIMGHGIYLSSKELKMLATSKTSIAHCPTSNAPVSEQGLGSGLFDFRKIEKSKIHWALGSDIGGGPFLSMFDVMRSFVVQNKKKKIKEATFSKALYRATLAGAKMLGLEKSEGNLNKGKWGNFVVLDMPKFTASARKSLDAEKILSHIILKQVKDRKDYDLLPRYVFLRGELLYNYRASSKTTGQ